MGKSGMVFFGFDLLLQTPTLISSRAGGVACKRPTLKPSRSAVAAYGPSLVSGSLYEWLGHDS